MKKTFLTSRRLTSVSILAAVSLLLAGYSGGAAAAFPEDDITIIVPYAPGASADLLARDVERHVREAPMHGTQHARKHRAVADTGVEQAHCGRTRVNVREFQRDPPRHNLLLATGVHEQKVLLAIVEEAEVAGRIFLARFGIRGGAQEIMRLHSAARVNDR